jgi:hypothetical protein
MARDTAITDDERVRNKETPPSVVHSPAGSQTGKRGCEGLESFPIRGIQQGEFWAVPFQARYSARNAAFANPRARSLCAWSAGTTRPRTIFDRAVHPVDAADFPLAVEHVEVIVLPTAFAPSGPGRTLPCFFWHRGNLGMGSVIVRPERRRRGPQPVAAPLIIWRD